MTKKWHILIVITGLFFFTVAGAETLTIPGTGACQNLLEQLAQQYSKITPGQEVQVPPSTGSGGGIRSVMNQEAILARVARPLKSKESKLSYLPFAKDAVVFVVGKKVGINSISKENLFDIFTGKITDWGQLGGENRKIRVLVREKEDSSLSEIMKNLPSFRGIEFLKQSKVLYHEQEMVKMLDKYHYAIGWAYGSSLSKDQLSRVVFIDGVSPGPDNILSGTYPIAGEYALVFTPEKLTLPARKFIDFVFSDQAGQIMEGQGVIPMPRKQ